MSLRVPVNPELLRWALRRSGRTLEGLSCRFRKLDDWLQGRLQPTLNQLEAFARATHTPIGYFFLPGMSIGYPCVSHGNTAESITYEHQNHRG